MKRHAPLLLLLFFASFAMSQTLSGTVKDASMQSIPGATVYLNGTSIWAITDENGQYELQVSSQINTELIVNALGYEPFAIADPFAQNPAKIVLTASVTKLHEVTVHAALFTRKQMLKRFREEFLGTTKAGNSCKIKNEDDLYFEYDPKTFVFKAHSDKPLVVENPHLGFEMEFMLTDFYVVFHRKTLHVEDIRQWMLSGTTLYREYPKSERYEKARAKSYAGSQMQFFRMLTRNALGRDNFVMYKDSWACNPDDYFKIDFKGGLYTIDVAQKPDQKIEDFLQTFSLRYKNGDVSSLTIKIPTFQVDRYGNYDSFEYLSFSGAMAQKRAGDLLPVDYKLVP